MKNNKETCICAAVKYEGWTWFGHRHADAIKAMKDELSYDMTRKQVESLDYKQGFITTNNRFVDRKEGFKLQRGIRSKADIPYLHNELYSEDLY